MIEGVEYGPCGYCHSRYPIEELGWSDDLQAWVCAEQVYGNQLCQNGPFAHVRPPDTEDLA